MNKNDKKIIKHFDLVIKNLDDVFAFSPNNILHEIIEPKTTIEEKSFLELVDDVKYFGRKNKYFESINKDGWCKLTEKGIELKDYKKGHLKFINSLKNKNWYNDNWVGYLIAFIMFLFTVFQYFQNNHLNKDYDSLESKYDSLFEKSRIYKNSVKELNEKIELQRLKTYSDTLQPENLTD